MAMTTKDVLLAHKAGGVLDSTTWDSKSPEFVMVDFDLMESYRVYADAKAAMDKIIQRLNIDYGIEI